MEDGWYTSQNFGKVQLPVSELSGEFILDTDC